MGFSFVSQAVVFSAVEILMCSQSVLHFLLCNL